MSDEAFEQLQQIVGPVSRETFDRLKSFEASLLRWNRSINLIGASTKPELWARHILDSTQLAALAPTVDTWLDLGSGGGLPGLVLAILCKERRNTAITMVESNRKKAGFLQAMIGEMNLPAKVQAVRVEDAHISHVEVVTARAFAPLPMLLQHAAPWLSNGSRGLFHKGRDYEREIAESLPVWVFDLIQHRSVVRPDGVILEISNLRRR